MRLPSIQQIQSPTNHAAQNTMAANRAQMALDNVRVFDGKSVLPQQTVIIDGPFISRDVSGAEHIDGKGQLLLPGFIDTHCHPTSVDNLLHLSSFINTAVVQSYRPDVSPRLLAQTTPA